MTKPKSHRRVDTLDDNGFLQYTHWRSAESPIVSQYGEITYGRWCELESARIARCGRATAVYTRERDCALWGAPTEGFDHD